MGCLVVGHRGASAAFPENTLEAFAGAAALGADWVELDVHRCTDGVPVVHHDATLPDGRRLDQIPATARPASVPTLAEALEVCRAHGLGVNVEIKSDPREATFDPTYAVVDATLAVLGDPLAAAGEPLADGGERYLVTSFDPGCLVAVRERADLATGQLAMAITDVARLIDRAAAAGHVAVNPWDPYVDAAFVELAHGAGLRVLPWTVDDPDRQRELARLGVDGIITNVPDILRTVLAST